MKKKSNQANQEEAEPPHKPSPISLLKLKKDGPSEKRSFFTAKNLLNKTLVISYQLNQRQFKIFVGHEQYSVRYPNGALKNLDFETKTTILDNFIYNRTIPLSAVTKKIFYYQSKPPLLKSLSDYGVIKDLPRFSSITKKTHSALSDNFKKIKKSATVFKQNAPPAQILTPFKTSPTKAILSLSFGKDSLLTYGLAKEIGIELFPVFINDMGQYNPRELKLKKTIIRAFKRVSEKSVVCLSDETDNVFRKGKFSKSINELDGTNAILSFALELIPFALYFRAQYLLFGNEKNLDDFFLDHEKTRVYPSFDQSTIYMRKQNKYLNILTNNKIQVASLVKPLYTIAEYKILCHRYPQLLKFIMSCASDKLKDNRWCQQCTTCTRGFLLMAAVGGNPQDAGIKTNLFEKKYAHLYALFNSKIERIYDRPPDVRDEQLLAFLLAHRNGFKGSLIDLFAQNYLSEAKRKEAFLRKKFFGLHSPNLLPSEYKKKLVQIFSEELKGWS